MRRGGNRGEEGFKMFIFIYLKVRERDWTCSQWFMLKCIQQLGLKPGSSSFTGIFHMGGRGLGTWAINCCFPACIGSELEPKQKCWTQAYPPICDMNIPCSVLSHHNQNTHPNSLTHLPLTLPQLDQCSLAGLLAVFNNSKTSHTDKNSLLPSVLLGAKSHEPQGLCEADDFHVCR